MILGFLIHESTPRSLANLHEGIDQPKDRVPHVNIVNMDLIETRTRASFLGLPAEVRLMIYKIVFEEAKIEVRVHRIHHASSGSNDTVTSSGDETSGSNDIAIISNVDSPGIDNTTSGNNAPTPEQNNTTAGRDVRTATSTPVELLSVCRQINIEAHAVYAKNAVLDITSSVLGETYDGQLSRALTNLREVHITIDRGHHVAVLKECSHGKLIVSFRHVGTSNSCRKRTNFSNAQGYDRFFLQRAFDVNGEITALERTDLVHGIEHARSELCERMSATVACLRRIRPGKNVIIPIRLTARVQGWPATAKKDPIRIVSPLRLKCDKTLTTPGSLLGHPEKLVQQGRGSYSRRASPQVLRRSSRRCLSVREGDQPHRQTGVVSWSSMAGH